MTDLFKGMGQGALLSAGDDRVKLYLAVSDSIPAADRERLIRATFAEALKTYAKEAA